MINSKASIDASKLQTYPKLKAYKSMVVLFTDSTTGTVVSDVEDPATIGQHASSWDPALFTEYQGIVTLENAYD